MLRAVRRFGKHCSCHLQGECVEAGQFWKPYIGQATSGELDLMVVIGGAGCYLMGEENMVEEKR
jgi:hypothetical protein